ncbi:hypothetical protein [Myroides odoratus]|uniref:hypothetical protein n=1 Tax=Myroides odoratus TaxID=256 RepID=UPI000A82313F|nr:hypothetical protein [Myroides odoratus]
MNELGIDEQEQLLRAQGALFIQMFQSVELHKLLLEEYERKKNSSFLFSNLKVKLLVPFIIRKTKKWIPAKDHGKLVRSQFTLPITLQLDPADEEAKHA